MDASATARFLKDVTAALKNVQDMENNSREDLTDLSDDQIEKQIEEAEAREREANARLLKALPRGKDERDE